MAFKDLGDWSQIGGMDLPICGKVYKIPAVSAELGPRLQAIMSVGIDLHEGRDVADGDREVLDDMGERDLYHDVLHPCGEDCDTPKGEVCPRDIYAEMIADKVPWPAIKHAALTVMFDATISREQAEQFWESQGKAPAPAANRQSRRSKPSAAAIKAKKPASTAGTTSRSKAPAKATRGRKSSSTGR